MRELIDTIKDYERTDIMKKLLNRFRWWLTHENKHCKSFCVTCPYFERCVEDVKREKYLEAKCNLASLYGMSVRDD